MAASPITATPNSLFQLLRDVVELGVERAADCIDGGDNHDRNAGGDQSILDGGSTGLVFKKSHDFRHGAHSLA